MHGLEYIVFVYLCTARTVLSVCLLKMPRLSFVAPIPPAAVVMPRFAGGGGKLRGSTASSLAEGGPFKPDTWDILVISDLDKKVCPLRHGQPHKESNL